MTREQFILELELLAAELETDVEEARTRDESMRMTRRALRVRNILRSLPLEQGSETLVP